MKKTAIFIFITLLTTGRIMAQSKDSVPSRKAVECGTSGDLIVGKENRKSQLNATPQSLQQNDSLNKQPSTQLKKKIKSKKT